MSRRGRDASGAAGPAKPVPGSTGAAPPALDGSGTTLAGGNGGGTVIGIERRRRGAAAGLGLPGGAGGAQAPLALGGAPQKGAAGLPGGVPPGVPGTTPGGAGGQVPPQGQQAAAGRPPPGRQLDRRMPGAGDERLRDALLELDAITRRLRRECPWDREQDERSIVPHTVEEAYELADAAHSGDDAKLLDELGDVLFQVYFLALLLEERGAGDLAAVAAATRDKLVRRHPHIFGEQALADLPTDATTAAEVKENWDAIKEREGERASSPSSCRR